MRPSQINDKKALSLVLRGLFRLNTSFANTRFLYYTNEIRNAVLVIHGDKAHSYYMGKDAFEKLNGNNKK